MKNEGTLLGRVSDRLGALRQTPLIKAVNAFTVSPMGMALVALLTVIVHITATEMILYTLAVLYGLYVCAFGDDFLTLAPFFVFCYIAPARENNPGRNNASVFTGATGVTLLVLAAVLIVFVILRIALDPALGFKKFFLKKRALLYGMLAIGLAYVASGLFSGHYGEIWHKNILFGLLQFATVFLLYFLFTALVDWSKAPKDYFAWIGFFTGCVVALEIFSLYLFHSGEFIANGTIEERWNIYLGWGMHNNIGAMLAVATPFAFYLAGRYRHGYLLLLPAVGMMAALLLTTSRTSMGVGGVIFVVSALLMAYFCKNRRLVLIVGGVLLAVVAALALAFGGRLLDVLRGFFENGLLNDSGRSELYRAGWRVFLADPIFGEGFYPADMSTFASAYWFSGYDLTGFMPPRWHNTVIQLLASCGLVGVAAYVYHRVQTVRMFLRGFNRERLFIGLSLLGLLCMSLLDCHFFNLGPTMFYSLALAFAECTGDSAPTQAVAEMHPTA